MMIDLPAYCAAHHPVDGRPIMIRRGEPGYVEWPKDNPISPEDFNRVHDIDEAVVQSMICCSMTGAWSDANVPEMRRALERGKEHARQKAYGRRARFSNR